MKVYVSSRETLFMFWGHDVPYGTGFVPVPGIFPFFFGWYRSRYRKKFVPEKVPVPVSEKIGPGKKYHYRYRKKLVPEKSTGPGTGKILGTVTLWCMHCFLGAMYFWCCVFGAMHC